MHIILHYPHLVDIGARAVQGPSQGRQARTIIRLQTRSDTVLHCHLTGIGAWPVRRPTRGDHAWKHMQNLILMSTPLLPSAPGWRRRQAGAASVPESPGLGNSQIADKIQILCCTLT